MCHGMPVVSCSQHRPVYVSHGLSAQTKYGIVYRSVVALTFSVPHVEYTLLSQSVTFRT
jgi:hypothetical protein